MLELQNYEDFTLTHVVYMVLRKVLVNLIIDAELGGMIQGLWILGFDIDFWEWKGIRGFLNFVDSLVLVNCLGLIEMELLSFSAN